MELKDYITAICDKYDNFYFDKPDNAISNYHLIRVAALMLWTDGR